MADLALKINKNKLNYFLFSFLHTWFIFFIYFSFIKKNTILKLILSLLTPKTFLFYINMTSLWKSLPVWGASKLIASLLGPTYFSLRTATVMKFFEYGKNSTPVLVTSGGIAYTWLDPWFQILTKYPRNVPRTLSGLTGSQLTITSFSTMSKRVRFSGASSGISSPIYSGITGSANILFKAVYDIDLNYLLISAWQIFIRITR